MPTLTLTVESPGFRGLFIARHEGKIVMIKGPVLPGETVEVAIDSERKDYITASLLRVLSPSSSRTTPPCPYYGTCGGCQLQHARHDRQITLKQAVLGDCLRRLAGLDTILEEPLTDGRQWHYRIRGQFKVSGGAVGLHKRGTRDVVPVKQCLLMDREINDCIPRLNRVIGNYRVREVHLTIGDALVALIITRKGVFSSAREAEGLAFQLLDAGLAGLVILCGESAPFAFGRSSTTLPLEDLRYTLSPRSFVQANWLLNRSVAAAMKDYLRPLAGKKVLDLYAGAGNFSLPLAEEASLVAVEGNRSAAEDGIRNIEINGIRNCRFVSSSAENFQSPERFDAVILDPPRPGLTKRALRNVLSLEPEKIVYLSCNPSTLARDLKGLRDKYAVDSLRMIDFFPQTYHIESLALLSLR